jgi:hypothetical protein
MPDYLKYHESLTDELHSLKDRIRNLIDNRHWLTDGEHKEAALRAILRRHLPESLIVGRGFIVTEQESSTQIDLLIVDGNKPTLFKDGDLMFVTPDCVKAVVEVKTSLKNTKDLKKHLTKLAGIGKLCRDKGGGMPWLGLFCYEEDLQDYKYLLDAVQFAYGKIGFAVNAVAYGRDRFVRFWRYGELEEGDKHQDSLECRWRVYDLENLASAYFVGNVVDTITGISDGDNSGVWYPLTDGKKVHMLGEQIMDNKKL